jgi:glycopeptide antibiotics resistance protein
MKLWKWWILVVAVVSGPWFGFSAEPQWHRVTWIPFRGFEDKPRDVLANFLLFVPFGFSFAWDRVGRSQILAAVLAGSIVSICVEVPQLFYRMRDPSATDVLMAVCGAAAGSVAAKALAWGHSSGTASRSEAGQPRREQ